MERRSTNNGIIHEHRLLFSSLALVVTFFFVSWSTFSCVAGLKWVCFSFLLVEFSFFFRWTSLFLQWTSLFWTSRCSVGGTVFNAQNAGAAFFEMNAISCGILQATKKNRIFSDQQQCQCNFSSSFVNAQALCFSFLRHCFFSPFCALYFDVFFCRTHNEFTMVVDAMMRLNIKLLFFHARPRTHTHYQSHWFSINSIGIGFLLLYYQVFTCTFPLFIPTSVYIFIYS